MFSFQSVSENPLEATFQLSSAASLNLGVSKWCIREWLKAPFTTVVAFAASVDQDQAAQNVEPDL